jgi:serine/threonine protein phosphatase PrpC
MKIVAGNAQHIGARQDQQDSFGFSDPGNEAFVAHGGFLGVVADGMGGLSHGSEASHAAVRTFLSAYESKAPGESIPDALARSLIAANRAVVTLADHFGSRNGTGTTLAAAVLHGDSLYWVSAGDSRVYLCHGNTLTRITSDHVYARHLNEQVAQGKISRSEAEGNAERAALTSFLGDLKEVDRSLRPFVVRPGDHIFICSDGLYRALSEAEITEAFRRDPQTACDTLVEQAVAKQRNHQDNLTIIALSPERSSAPDPAAGHRALLVFAALVLAAAIGGGIYARLWWNHYRGQTAPAPPANGSVASETVPATPAGTGAATPRSPANSAGPSGAAAGLNADSGVAPPIARDQGSAKGRPDGAGKPASPTGNAPGAAVEVGSQVEGGQTQPAQAATDQGQTSQGQSGSLGSGQSSGPGSQQAGQGATPGETAPGTQNVPGTTSQSPLDSSASQPKDTGAGPKPPANPTPGSSPPPDASGVPPRLGLARSWNEPRSPGPGTCC